MTKHFNLHSTMVLLKYTILVQALLLIPHLHSTMVLLKSIIKDSIINKSWISTFHYGSIKMDIIRLFALLD